MRSLILSLSIRMLTGFTIILAEMGHTSSSTVRPFRGGGACLHDVHDHL